MPTGIQKVVLFTLGRATDLDGTLVLCSTDQWKTAQQLGMVSNNVSAVQGGFVPSHIEIAGTVYSVQEFFSDGSNAAIPSPGNRTQFPLVDITAQVEALLSQSFFTKGEITVKATGEVWGWASSG